MLQDKLQEEFSLSGASSSSTHFLSPINRGRDKDRVISESGRHLQIGRVAFVEHDIRVISVSVERAVGLARIVSNVVALRQVLVQKTCPRNVGGKCQTRKSVLLGGMD